MAKIEGRKRFLTSTRKRLLVIGLIKALGVWVNSSSGFEDEEQLEDSSMLAVKDYDEIYNGLFAFMAQPDDKEDDDEEVMLLDLKDNLDLYSSRELKKLTCVLIDSIYELTTEKNLLNNSVDVS